MGELDDTWILYTFDIMTEETPLFIFFPFSSITFAFTGKKLQVLMTSYVPRRRLIVRIS